MFKKIKKYLLHILLLFVLYFLSTLTSLFSATIYPASATQGDEISFTINTTGDITETTTWKGEVFEPSVSIPGCSVSDVEYNSKRVVSGKITVLRNADIGNQTGYIYINNSGGSENFTFKVKSKPQILSCIPAADYKRTGTQSFTFMGNYFDTSGDATINIVGANISGTVTPTNRGKATLNMPLTNGIPGGPYAISMISADGGVGISEDGSGNGTTMFTLYPAPAISGIDKSVFYQGESAAQMTVYGNGFNSAASVEIVDSSNILTAKPVSGVTVAPSSVSDTQIIVNITVAKDSAVSSTPGTKDMYIRVTNPDGSGGTANRAISSSAFIEITKKLTPTPSGTGATEGTPIKKEQGFTGNIILTSSIGQGQGFDSVTAPTVNIYGNGITLNSFSKISTSTLVANITIDEKAEVGTSVVVVNNPTWETSNMWYIEVSSATKTKLKYSTLKVGTDIASINLDTYTITQGTTSVCYIDINSGEGTFEDSPTITGSTGLTISDIMKISDTRLYCKVTATPTATVGNHMLTVTNPTYNAAKTIPVTITKSPYSKIDEATITVSPSFIEQGTVSNVIFSIDELDDAKFETSPTATVSGSGITVGSVVRQTNKKLVVQMTTDKTTSVIGEHLVTISNATYGSVAISSISVTTTVYNNPTITADALSSTGTVKLYQGDSKQLTIKGKGFASDAEFTTTSSNLTISNVVINSSTEAIITVAVNSDTTEGLYSLIIKNKEFASSYISQDYFYIEEKHSISSISPSMLAPDTSYNFYINGLSFDTKSNFKIFVDGEEVIKSTDPVVAGVDTSKYVVFTSTRCVSKVQIACSIFVGSNVPSGYHDIGVYFESNGSTSTQRGILNIPNRPIISEIANTVSQGDTNKDVVIQGQNFEQGASVVVSGSGIIISTITVTSENSITFRCDVTEGAEKTDREVKVINPTGLYATGTLKVIAPPSVSACSPSSVIRGTSRYLEIKGTNFSKNFKLNFSGKFLDVSTYSAVDKQIAVTKDSNYVYLLDAYYTGNTQITATVYIGTNVVNGLYDIGVINYLDETKTVVEAEGEGAGLFDIRTPLSITNSEVTVPVGYEMKAITLTGSGFSEDSEISVSGSGVNIISDNTKFINTQEMEIVISVDSTASAGKRTLTIKDNNNSAYSSFIKVIPAVSITNISPSIVSLGVKVATITITGSYFDIEFDTNTIVEVSNGVKGCAILDNSIEILGGGIDSLCIDTTTYNSSYIQLFGTVNSTATIGTRDIRITNKDGENIILKESAFSIDETVDVTIFNPQSFQVNPTAGTDDPTDFVITGSNLSVAVSADKDVVKKYLSFTNNDNLEFKSITSKTDTEIKGTFGWKSGQSTSNIGNRSVNIQVTNEDGSIGTLQGGLLLSEPLSIDSISPAIIPISAKNLVITVKGKGILENPTVYFYKDGDTSVKNNITITKKTLVSSTELTLYLDTTSDLGTYSASDNIKLYIQNTAGDSISSDPLVVPIITGEYPTIHSVEPNTIRVKGNKSGIVIKGANFNSITSISFSNGLIFSTTSITSTEIIGDLSATNAYSGNATININTITSETALINKGKFTVDPAPVIDSLTPTIFYKGISSVLTVSGSNFDLDADGNGARVLIERIDKNEFYTIISTSNITTSSNRVVVSGLEFKGEGVYNITITNPDGSYISLEKAITVYQANNPATITDMNPSYGKPKDSSKVVEVQGANFMTGMTIYSKGGGITISTYTVNTTSASFTMNIDETATLGENSIIFANPNATKTIVPFYIVNTPVVTSVSPQSLTQNTTNTITINGSNFVSQGKEYSVKDLEYIQTKISGDGVKVVSAIDFMSSNYIKMDVYVSSTATIGKRDLIVTNPFTMSGIGASLLNIVAPMKVNTVYPSIVSQGDSSRVIVINGSGFQSGISVSFTGSGITVSTTNFISDSQIEVTISVDSSADLGYRGIKATNPDATPVVISDILTIGPAIVVERTNPSQIGRGVIEKEVEIIGSNFDTSTNTVKVSGTGITLGKVTTLGSTSIKVPFTIDANATVGTRDITVITSSGSQGTGSGVIEIVDAISITSIDPSEIPIYKNALKIWNETDSGANYTITGSTLTSKTLALNSGGNISISTDSSKTISTLISEINAIGNGWVAKSINTKVDQQYAIDLKNTTSAVNVYNSTSTLTFDASKWNTTTITFSGSGFAKDGTNVPTVTFSGDGINVESVQYSGSSQIKASLTFDSSIIDVGKRDVKVTNPDGTFGSLAGAIEFVDSLEITDQNITKIGKGISAGQLKIYGSGFTSNTQVLANDSEITVSDVNYISRDELWFKVTVPSDTTLTATTFKVYNTNGDAATLNLDIKKIPVVSSIEPAEVGQGASTTIVMKGSNLGYLNKDILSNVSFSGTDISVIDISSVTSSSVTAVIKVSKSAQTGTRTLTIKAPVESGGADETGEMTDIFKVVSAPIITSISPNSLYPDTTNLLTITGSGFKDGGILSFTTKDGDIELFDYNYQNETKIGVRMFVNSNAIAGTYDGTITNTDLSKNTTLGILTILNAPKTPQVDAVSPGQLNFGVNNQTLVITGSGFEEGFTPSFSGGEITISSYTWISDSKIKIEVSVATADNSLDGYRTITITNPTGKSESFSKVFALVSLPVVTSMEPTSVSQGTTVPIYLTGTGFTSTQDVNITISDNDGITISSVSVSGNTQLLFDVFVSTLSHTGAHDITVTTKNGSGVGYGVFVVDPFLSLIKIEPSKVSQGASEREVYVYGTGFQEDSTLEIQGGGVTINKLYYQNEKQLKAIITLSDSATLGDRKIIVTNTNGTNVEKTGIFQVIKPITVTKITPSQLGIGRKSVDVVITGTEFKDNAELSFTGSGIEISTFTINSTTKITATLNIADDATAQTVDVTVLNEDGNSGKGSGLLEIIQKVKVESLANNETLDKSDYFVITASKITGKQIKVKGSGFAESEAGMSPEVSFSMSAITVTNVAYVTANELLITVDIDVSKVKAGDTSDVTVINPDGTIGTGSSVYSAVATLAITKITPKELAQGATGTKLVVLGDGFVESGMKVAFVAPHLSYITVNSINYESANQIELDLDIKAEAVADRADFTITNKNGDIVYSSSSLSATNCLKITDAPVIKEVYPSSLQQGATGQILTITGTSFLPDGWTLATAFSISGGVYITTMTVTNTEIVATVNVDKDATIGTRNIVITTTRNSGETTGTAEGLFEITTYPKVSSVSPEAVYQGRKAVELILYGAGFSDKSLVTISNEDVVIDGTPKINSSASISLKVNISETAKIGYCDITIDNQNGSVGTTKSRLEVREPAIPPSVTNLSLLYLPVNSTKDIYFYGTNFQDGIDVDLRDSNISISTISYISSSQIKITVEVGSDVKIGKYNIVLTNPDGGVLTIKNAVEVVAQPEITSVDPSSIIKSTDSTKTVNLTLYGTNFSTDIDPDTIVIGDDISVDTYTFTFISSTEINFDILISSYTKVGKKDIEFMNPSNFFARLTSGLEIRETVLPTITKIEPSKIPLGVTDKEILITGNNFREGIMVESPNSDIIISTVTYVSNLAVKIYVTVEKDANVGSYNLVFRNPYSGDATVENALELIGQPTITSIEPSEIVVDTTSVKTVLLRVSGENFHKDIDPSLINIGNNSYITIKPDTFVYHGKTSISFEVLVSSITPIASYDIEIYNPAGIKGSGTGLVKVVSDTGTLIKNVSTSSNKIDFETNIDALQKKIDFYFTLTESCKVELLIFNSTDTNFTYSQEKIVYYTDYLTAGTYDSVNPKLSWDGTYPGTERKINGNYKYIIRATSKSNSSTYVDYYGKDGTNISLLAVDVVNISNVSVDYTITGEAKIKTSPYTLNYTLSKATDVKIEIVNSSGTIIKNFSESGTLGENKKVWDGLMNNGVRADKGTYTIRFNAEDSSGDKAETKTCTIAVEPLNIVDLEITALKESEGAVGTISFLAAQAMRVDVNIYKPGATLVTTGVSKLTSSGESVEIKTISSDAILVRTFTKYVEAGATCTIEWDGKDDRGDILIDGDYVVLLNAKDSNGVAITDPIIATLSVNRNGDINLRRKIFEKNTYPYPNPVNANDGDGVKIAYSMSKEGSISCYIYDVIGNLVWKTSVSDLDIGNGYIPWDLRSRSGKKVGRGLYIIVMEGREKNTGEMLKTTKKMMVIK